MRDETQMLYVEAVKVPGKTMQGKVTWRLRGFIKYHFNVWKGNG
jgi:hypothetical protein